MDFLYIIIFVMAGCFLLSWVFVKYPQGDDYSLIRLGLAAICRTLLPLVIFLLMEYTTPFQIRDYFAPIVLTYLISLALATTLGWNTKSSKGKSQP